MSFWKFAPVFVAGVGIAAISPLAENITHKLDLIESGRVKPGAVITFSSAELNAWVRVKAPSVVPQGFRNPRLELGNGTATGYALVDFLKIGQAAGIEANWFVAKLIEGEKRVTATATIQSAEGRATVHLVQVDVGGVAVSGAALDFMIRTFFQPLYPNAKIDEPFDLADGIDHIDVTPGEARVYIKKK